MSDLNQDALDILQEECAEIIQAISKFRRWGPDSQYPQGGPTNLEQLQYEWWDAVIIAELAGVKLLPPPAYVIAKSERLKNLFITA